MGTNHNSSVPAWEANGVFVRRLCAGDETLARDAINLLKPVVERDGKNVDAAFMREFLATESNYLVVAYEGDTPLGYALAYRLPRVDRRRDMMYLHDVGVVENRRRQGIGRRMIRECLRLCREEGFVELFVIADADNVPAKGLYESTGGTAFAGGSVVFGYTFL